MIANGLRNPRSEVWNLEVDRQVTREFFVRVAYHRNFFLDPIAYGSKGNLSLSDRGGDSHKEFQITGGYRIRRSTLNASSAGSRAYRDFELSEMFRQSQLITLLASSRC